MLLIAQTTSFHSLIGRCTNNFFHSLIGRCTNTFLSTHSLVGLALFGKDRLGAGRLVARSLLMSDDGLLLHQVPYAGGAGVCGRGGGGLVRGPLPAEQPVACRARTAEEIVDK